MRGLDVDQYEDSGGRLHLVRDGDDVASCNLETLPHEDFRGGLQRDAAVLTTGETGGWPLDTVPADQVSGHVIAFYNDENDVAPLATDRDGEPIAGRNGRGYVGDTEWLGRSKESWAITREVKGKYQGSVGSHREPRAHSSESSDGKPDECTSDRVAALVR